MGKRLSGRNAPLQQLLKAAAQTRSEERILAQRFGAELYGQGRSLAWRQGDLIGSYITAFDADHPLIFVIAKIRHLLSSGNPRIPNDSRERAFFFNADLTTESRVMDFDWTDRIQIDAIDF